MYPLGRCPFHDRHDVSSESEYKRVNMARGRVMLHAQMGYRDPALTRRRYEELYDKIDKAGYTLDRIGFSFDQNMGYPSSMRDTMPKGTALILREPEEFIALTGTAPAAPHFGDFLVGMPASVENTGAALLAGSTTIGNIGQYFAYRATGFDDDIHVTGETIKAAVMVGRQSHPATVQSNLNDGYAALFVDLSCALGWMLVEQYIFEDLLGARVSYCFGHNFSMPVLRVAFQMAAAEVASQPGSMVFGNTAIYDKSGDATNYAALASYLIHDIMWQKHRPTGHAINPVPVTEAFRIPDVDEILNAHLFANRLIERAGFMDGMFDYSHDSAVGMTARKIVKGGRQFKDNVIQGLAEAGIDTNDAFELLLSLRRLGARRIEELFGPGTDDASQARGRQPIVKSNTIADLEETARLHTDALEDRPRAALKASKLKGCVAATDVHEYGKIQIESVCSRIGVETIDGGVSADPKAVAAIAGASGADFIAISTYNGIGLEFSQALRKHMRTECLDVPVFIGGMLNRVSDRTNSGLPTDVTRELAGAGVVPCHNIDEFLQNLLGLVK